MSSCSRDVYSKRRTHDYGGVRRIGQKLNVMRIRYNVDPAKFHVDPDIDVTQSAGLYLDVTVTEAYLSVIFAKY